VRKQVEVELNDAMAAADEANRAKTDFLSSMSHELRTPLNAILGFAQLMETGTPVPTPGQRRNLDQILKAGWYLLELINEMLDLALIESGKVIALARAGVAGRGLAGVPRHDRAAGAQARHRHELSAPAHALVCARPTARGSSRC
jgi:signal transduction histidine kinase